ncbi:hypothetical protein K402DRAFT_344088, partial [Aulographum hederae CBS 113979]
VLLQASVGVLSQAVRFRVKGSGQSGATTNPLTEPLPKICHKLGPSIRNNGIWESFLSPHKIQECLYHCLGRN